MLLSRPKKRRLKESTPQTLNDSMRTQEHQLILDALHQYQGSRKEVAKQLGISTRTLRYKLAHMREEGIDIPQP